MEWYQKSPSTLEQELETDIKNGLSEETAKQRLQQYGENKLEEAKKKPFSK